MAFSLRAAGSSQRGTATSKLLASGADWPASAVAGDVIIVEIIVNTGTTQTFSQTGGTPTFTIVQGVTANGAFNYMFAYAVLTAGFTLPTFAWQTSAAFACNSVAYSSNNGPIVADKFDSTCVTSTASANNTSTPASVTGSKSKDLSVVMGPGVTATGNTPGTYTWTRSSGYTLGMTIQGATTTPGRYTVADHLLSTGAATESPSAVTVGDGTANVYEIALGTFLFSDGDSVAASSPQQPPQPGSMQYRRRHRRFQQQFGQPAPAATGPVTYNLTGGGLAAGLGIAPRTVDLPRSGGGEAAGLGIAPRVLTLPRTGGGLAAGLGIGPRVLTLPRTGGGLAAGLGIAPRTVTRPRSGGGLAAGLGIGPRVLTLPRTGGGEAAGLGVGTDVVSFLCNGGGIAAGLGTGVVQVVNLSKRGGGIAAGLGIAPRTVTRPRSGGGIAAGLGNVVVVVSKPLPADVYPGRFAAYPPQGDWAAGPPRGDWAAGAPQGEWAAGPPQPTGYEAGAPQGDWAAGPPEP